MADIIIIRDSRETRALRPGGCQSRLRSRRPSYRVPIWREGLSAGVFQKWYYSEANLNVGDYAKLEAFSAACLRRLLRTNDESGPRDRDS